MLKLYDLKTEYRVNPIGLDVPQSAFSWKLKSDKKGVRQASCRITVLEGEACVWDSGWLKTDEGFHEGFEKQLQWIGFQDEILSSSYLTFEDGSTQQLTPSAAAPYENGVVTLTSNWNATIDISKVESITVMGTTYSFPQLRTESVSP